jgi:hypothetical protein
VPPTKGTSHKGRGTMTNHCYAKYAHECQMVYKRKELLRICEAYTKMVASDPKSLWYKKGSPIYKIKKKLSLLKLGKTQKSVLAYLFYHFFKRGMPVFINLTHLSIKIGCSKSQLSRAISSLRNKGVLITFQWKYQKGNNRLMILPANFEHMIIIGPDENQKILDDLNQQGLSTGFVNRGVYFLSSNDLESLVISDKSYIYYIYYFIIYKASVLNTNVFNKLQKDSFTFSKAVPAIANGSNTETLESNSCSNTSPQIKHTKYNLKTHSIEPRIKKIALNIKNQKPLTNDLISKIKKPLDSKFETTFESLAYNKFDLDKLNINDQNYLINYINFTYNIDWKSLFKNNRNIKAVTALNNKAMYMLLNIAAQRIPLEHELCEKVITYWNSMDCSVLEKPKIKTNGKTHLLNTIAITYVYHFLAEKEYINIEIAIDRLKEYHGRIKTLKNLNKIKFFNFFSDIQDKYLSKFLSNDGKDEFDFVNQFYPLKLKYPVQFKRFRELYLGVYWGDDNKKGNEIFDRYERLFAEWFENLCIMWDSGKRELYGLKLTLPQDEDNLYGNDPVIEDYFWYLAEEHGFYVSPFKIANENNWKRFCVDKMRDDRDLKEFFYIIPEEYRQD